MEETNTTTLNINSEAKYYLQETAKWAKFLAVVGFILTGILVVIGLAMGTIMKSLPHFENIAMPYSPFIFTLLYLIIAGIYIYSLVYIYFALQ